MRSDKKPHATYRVWFFAECCVAIFENAMMESMNMITAALIEKELKKRSSKEKAVISAYFFKTGEGQYGHGDLFMGVVVPDQRVIARTYWNLSLPEIENLLKNKIHECRLTALLILVEKYKRGDEVVRAGIVAFYLKHTAHINNWDLVDLSASYILGDYLFDKDRAVLYKLVKSRNMWERRIAIVATHAFIRKGDASETLALAAILLPDRHDLIHKATGWMLREVGKRVSRSILVAFIDEHKERMPRTMLRYAIEHFSPEERKEFLKR